MSAITTHILDTARGVPASGVPATLERRDGDAWKTLARGTTNEDGRIGDLLPKGEDIAPGHYRMIFATGDYFEASGTPGFYPQVTVEFQVRDGAQHYHVPLLLSPFGYSTYRGS